jgi:hypothetical protein
LQRRLTLAQEAAGVQLQRIWLPPPNDLLAVTNEFIGADVWRPALNRFW